jgi:quercetin dioxygenase-like cupin family protein
MKKVNEKDFEYRNKISGPKYLMRGPNIDWGVFLLKPGEKMGAHGHAKSEETFYVQSGKGNIYINDKPYPLVPGDVYYVEIGEKHDLENLADSKDDLKLIFIKTPYYPDDKITYK